MKNFSTILLAIVIALSGVSCQSINSSDPFVRIEKSTPYLRASAIIITNGVFSYAISDSDRAEKAKIVYDIATVIEQLTIDGDISIESVSEIISYYVPDRSHWHEFAANIILIYADVYAQVKDLEGDNADKRRILAKALNQIAGGCKAAASVYQE
mgnify:CR=1 FL=1